MQFSGFIFLLYAHSLLRWLVVVSLLYTLFRAARGYYRHTAFTAADNSARHITATIVHLQLLLGMLLYWQSPVTAYFRQYTANAMHTPDMLFFGLVHAVLMLAAVVMVTLGSAFAKRQATDHHRFKTLLIWYLIAFILIVIAIPWPFSPFAHRPLIR
jgi:hypothetical protein